MKHIIKHILTGSLIFALVVTPVTVFAMEGDEHSDDSTTTNTTDSSDSKATRLEEKRAEAERKLKERLDHAKQQRSDRMDEVKANLHERLSEAKKKVCERNQSRINSLMERMDSRREAAYDRITQIHEAITNFYGEKELTVTDYDSLIASVIVAQGVAQTSINDQKAVPSLNCDSDEPRADLSDFRQKRHDSIDAIKAYRDAVKDLAKAVKEAVRTSKAGEDS